MQYLLFSLTIFLLQIKLHEHWKDTTTVTWALHEALDHHYQDEVPRISALVNTEDGNKDSQPINITNSLKLQYEVCAASWCTYPCLII